MQTVVRVILAYVLLLVAFRVLGKRELRKMSAFELVTLLFIPQLFSRALTGPDYSFTNAVIGASTLLTLVWATSALSYRFPGAARMIGGAPAVLVSNGAAIGEVLDRERVSLAELHAELHRVGLATLAEVRWAILETSGAITIVPQPGCDRVRANPPATEGPQGF